MEDFRQKAKINLTYSLFLITYYFNFILNHYYATKVFLAYGIYNQEETSYKTHCVFPLLKIDIIPPLFSMFFQFFFYKNTLTLCRKNYTIYQVLNFLNEVILWQLNTFL